MAVKGLIKEFLVRKMCSRIKNFLSAALIKDEQRYAVQGSDTTMLSNEQMLVK
ncbi:MAG: hypothetical protein ABIP30_04155 [Ferruginibacter sp.]